MAALEVEIKKSYPGGPGSAAFNLSVAFSAGDGIIVLFGPSGSGKTLTLESIAGFVRPDEGRVRLNGETVFDSAAGIDLPARSRRCGYVFQKDALFPHMTVRENLQFAAAALPPEETERRIQEALSRFGLLDLAARFPHEISGGERQRCSIARTLVGRPRFLLLDEPARGLDIGLRQQLYGILRQVRTEYRLPLLLVTHDLEEAFELGDRMLVCQEGRIVQDGPPREVYERPVSATVARLLGIPNLFEGQIIELDSAENVTRLRAAGFELTAEFMAGYQPGDRIGCCIRPEQVLATPRNGAPGPGQRVLPLVRAVEMSDQVRLEFPGAVCAQVPRVAYEPTREAREWVIEFPAGAVWVFPEKAPEGD